MKGLNIESVITKNKRTKNSGPGRPFVLYCMLYTFNVATNYFMCERSDKLIDSHSQDLF